MQILGRLCKSLLIILSKLNYHFHWLSKRQMVALLSHLFGDYFFQRSFFTENHFLITAINLTTRGPLYTCLVFQREFDAKEFVGWLESQDIYPLLVYHFGSRNFCYFWQKTLQNGKKQFQIILLQNLLTSSVLKKCTFKTSPMLVVYSEANGKDKIL